LLPEQRAIASPRPAVDQLHQLESCAGDFADEDVLGDAVTAAVLGHARRLPRPQPPGGWEVDQRQQAAGTGRAKQTLIDLRGLSDMVIDAAQEDRLATVLRWAIISLAGGDHRDVLELHLANRLADVVETLGIDLRRKDMAVGADGPGHDHSCLAFAGANVRYGHGGLQFQQRAETGNLRLEPAIRKS